MCRSYYLHIGKHYKLRAKIYKLVWGLFLIHNLTTCIEDVHNFKNTGIDKIKMIPWLMAWIKWLSGSDNYELHPRASGNDPTWRGFHEMVSFEDHPSPFPFTCDGTNIIRTVILVIPPLNQSIFLFALFFLFLFIFLCYWIMENKKNDPYHMLKSDVE